MGRTASSPSRTLRIQSDRMLPSRRRGRGVLRHDQYWDTAIPHCSRTIKHIALLQAELETSRCESEGAEAEDAADERHGGPCGRVRCVYTIPGQCSAEVCLWIGVLKMPPAIGSSYQPDLIPLAVPFRCDVLPSKWDHRRFDIVYSPYQHSRHNEANSTSSERHALRSVPRPI